jgi:benzoate membrane transport protein
MPIVMGMVAGVFLKFGLNVVFALRDALWLAGPMTAAYFVTAALPGLARRLPPLIATLLTGIAVLLFQGDTAWAGAGTQWLAQPLFQVPEWSLPALLELVIPMAITVLVVQNAQGFAVLESAGHRPPVNVVTLACGAASMLTALCGTVSSCLTGPTNAMVCASGPRERHYTGALFVGVLGLAFGLLAPAFTKSLLATPPAFIAVLGGLAMLRVLQTAFTTAFRDRVPVGALCCFVVTVADVPIAGIGAPFWALLYGLLVSWLIERGDLAALGKR